MENTVNSSKGYGVLFQQYFSLATFHTSFDAFKDLRENLPPFWPQHGMAFASALRFGVRVENKRFLPSYNFCPVPVSSVYIYDMQLSSL
mmetsp:Transcript_17123/g.69351  ORF Transcript_17123/g.69351 Transcript_17123/m.69351 type:complete len:89 (+) Transcript_17123:910-1176(+)